MNKGLELIEAHHLFGIDAGAARRARPPARPIVHGLVQWRDGVVTAGLAPARHADPDRATPCDIGDVYRGRRPSLDLAAISRLSFEAADEERFPCLALARAALAAGGAMPTVLNAANEVAVAAFMAGRIGFYGIGDARRERSASGSPGTVRARAPATIDEALAIDADARRHRRVARSPDRWQRRPDGARRG